MGCKYEKSAAVIDRAKSYISDKADDPVLGIEENISLENFLHQAKDSHRLSCIHEQDWWKVKSQVRDAFGYIMDSSCRCLKKMNISEEMSSSEGRPLQMWDEHSGEKDWSWSVPLCGFRWSLIDGHNHNILNTGSVLVCKSNDLTEIPINKYDECLCLIPASLTILCLFGCFNNTEDAHQRAPHRTNRFIRNRAIRFNLSCCSFTWAALQRLVPHLFPLLSLSLEKVINWKFKKCFSLRERTRVQEWLANKSLVSELHYFWSRLSLCWSMLQGRLIRGTDECSVMLFCGIAGSASPGSMSSPTLRATKVLPVEDSLSHEGCTHGTPQQCFSTFGCLWQSHSQTQRNQSKCKANPIRKHEWFAAPGTWLITKINNWFFWFQTNLREQVLLFSVSMNEKQQRRLPTMVCKFRLQRVAFPCVKVSLLSVANSFEHISIRYLSFSSLGQIKHLQMCKFFILEITRHNFQTPSFQYCARICPFQQRDLGSLIDHPFRTQKPFHLVHLELRRDAELINCFLL